jgi:hypothetical protein
LSAAEIDALVAAKVEALCNTVAAIDPGRLKAVLTLGSVTAYGTHPGLSGYALASELVRRETARLAGRYRQTSWCTAEWSLWSGAGMARSVTRHAARELGMVPVPVMTGVAATVCLLTALISADDNRPIPGSLLIAGAVPGAEGAWAGRAEGIPGVEAALVVGSGADLDATVRAVAEAALPGLRLVLAATDQGRRSFLVRASVHGDRVDCAVMATDDPAAPALRHDRFVVQPMDIVSTRSPEVIVNA